MNNLIQISSQVVNNETIQTVNARDLHAFLDIKSKFATWITRRIEEYEFIENVDYVALSQNRESGGKMIEYFLTLNMAKELSMVERNRKGRDARQYFINCERVAKSPENEFTRIQAASLLLENITTRLRLSNSSYLGCQRKLHHELGLPTRHLPDYSIDASDKNAISSDIHHSLSHLLKEHGVKLSAKVVYTALDDKGITCWQARKRSNGTTKKFRSVTNTKYGLNLVNDRNKYETQPHFFDHKFDELMDKIGVK